MMLSRLLNLLLIWLLWIVKLTLILSRLLGMLISSLWPLLLIWQKTSLLLQQLARL